LGEAEDAIEDELLIHPGELRANVLKKAHDAGYGATNQPTHKKGQNSLASVAESGHGDSHDHDHAGHGDHGGEAPSEGNMNMRGVFLHVLGDAVRFSFRLLSRVLSKLTLLSLSNQLGNVGVIAAGLFIWLTDYEWRMYTDPGISLIITVISEYTFRRFGEDLKLITFSLYSLLERSSSR